MSRDISDYDTYAPAPMTKYKQVAINASKTPLEAFAQELTRWVVENLNGYAAFTTAQLAILCEKWGHDARPKTQYIKKALLSHGEIETSKLIKVGGKTSRYVLFKVTHSPVSVCTDSEIAKSTEMLVQQEIEQDTSF